MFKDYPVYKVAAVQAAPVYVNRPRYFDLDATLSKAVDLIEEAGKNGAKFVVFPETFLPGYPHFSMGLQTMAETGEFFHLWKQYLINSPVVPGPETDRIGAAARKAGCYIAMGMNERDPVHDGRMYNTILYVGPDGQVLGTHRKLNITINELFFHTRGDITRVEPRDNVRVYDSPIGKFSGLICGEHFQPLLKQYLVVEGTQIHAALWPGLSMIKTVMLIMTQSLCVSARCWAVLAAPYISKDVVPQDTYANNNFHMSVGGSAVVDPLGNIVAGPLYETEGIVYHDVDLGLIPIGKADTNLMGIYDRRDVMGLLCREQPFSPFVPMERLNAGGPMEYETQSAALNKRPARLELKQEDKPSV
jgi:predicted amidohydrolase